MDVCICLQHVCTMWIKMCYWGIQFSFSLSDCRSSCFRFWEVLKSDHLDSISHLWLLQLNSFHIVIQSLRLPVVCVHACGFEIISREKNERLNTEAEKASPTTQGFMYGCVTCVPCEGSRLNWAVRRTRSYWLRDLDQSTSWISCRWSNKYWDRIK